MRNAVIAICAAFAVVGCDKADAVTRSSTASQPATDNASKTDSVKTNTDPQRAPDNTGINERDRNTAALTPGDQGENERDRGITQAIRQAIVKDDALSMTAKNVKIITVNGVVTLRGPVKNEAEKNAIGAAAQSATGVSRVDNQLETKAN